MRRIHLSWAAGALALIGCGGPVPSGVFLTMSVSTEDTAVKTSVNGKPSEFLSGDSGSMSGSAPINRFVREGENEIIFIVSPAADPGEEMTPGFFASLEVSLKGEVVDTRAPGARTIFTRELTEAEAAAIAAGETVTIAQGFTINKTQLEAIKSGAAGR